MISQFLHWHSHSLALNLRKFRVKYELRTACVVNPFDRASFPEESFQQYFSFQYISLANFDCCLVNISLFDFWDPVQYLGFKFLLYPYWGSILKWAIWKFVLVVVVLLLGHHNFRLVLDDYWSKKIYRPARCYYSSLVDLVGINIPQKVILDTLAPLWTMYKHKHNIKRFLMYHIKQCQHCKWKTKYEILSSPRVKRGGPKGLRAESARAVWQTVPSQCTMCTL